jgi:flagellin
MRINHNIQALNAYRNLSQTMGHTSKSLEKLSSGLRINRAADDAAGLAISEKMRSQIRGLEMAERNTLDAISLIQTGEGALNQTHQILQRMRELSVQASNGTLEDQDRKAIQNEIDQLTFEIDRIADTTQFNQKKLFSGQEQGISFADISSSSIQYSGNGTWEGVVTATPTAPAEVLIELPSGVGQLDDTASPSEIDGKTFTINGKTYEVDTSGANPGMVNGNIAVNVTWTSPAANDSDIKTNIENLMTSLEQAIKDNDPDFSSSASFVSQLPADSDADNLNGVIDSGILKLVTDKNMSVKDAKEIDLSSDVSGVKFLDPADATTATTTMVGQETASVGESTTLSFGKLPKNGDQIIIDNLVIDFSDSSSISYAYDSANSQGTATINVSDMDVFGVVNKIKEVLNDASADTLNDPVKALSSSSVVGNSLVLTTDRTEDDFSPFDAVSNGLEIKLFDSNYEEDKTKDLEVELQIGANASEVLDISIGIMDAAKLGLARDSDGNVISSVGVNAEQGVDVSSSEAARQAITRLDEAIRVVSQERSKLGAIQNRLEHTTTNLQTANENLTSAESRIRDADMAKEMTTFTKNNILNQAGQAMLAQANQLPQGILQLLK